MRFAEGDYEFSGQTDLWEHALERAMSGPKGQQVLRDLEQALLELPSKKLIAGGLSDGVNVCAVGAFVAHRRVAGGEHRSDILDELATYDDDEGGWESEQRTIDEARAVGMQLTIACAIAGENDWYYKLTDEERYDFMLLWVRKRIMVPA